MFRNENELIDSLFHKLNRGKETKPSPLTEDELSEIEQYRDDDGLIDLTHVTSLHDLKRLVGLVDRKNHIEELDNEKSKTVQDLAGELLSELLPLLGVEKANLKVSTPAGKASIEVGRDKEPKIVYEKADGSDINLSYTVTPSDLIEECADECKEKKNLGDTCHLYDCGTCADYHECFDDAFDKINEHNMSHDGAGAVSLECEGGKMNDERVVKLVCAGGTYNPLFENAVAYICENEHFADCGVYTDADVVPDEVNVYVLLPNAFGKIYSAVADTYFEVLDTADAQVYIIDTESFELTEITNPFDLYDYAMTEAQEEAIGY